MVLRSASRKSLLLKALMKYSKPPFLAQGISQTLMFSLYFLKAI